MEQQRTQHRKVKVGTIIFDPRFNRPIDRPWVEKLKRGMDPSALGTVELWQTEDGCLVCIDGQHRVVAVSEVLGPTAEVPAKIHSGISLREAARLFRVCNARRHLTPLDNFRAGEAEGDPEALGIIKILGEHGLKYGSGHQQATVGAVKQLQAIYRIGPDVLSSTLGLLTEVWGNDSTSYSRPLINGFGLLIGRHKDTIDLDWLCRKLAGLPGGAPGVVGRARGRVTYMKGSLVEAVVENAIATYNKGVKGSARLPSWDTGAPLLATEPAPRRSPHKTQPAKAQPARQTGPPGYGTIRSRIRGLLEADPLQSFSTADLVEVLKRDGLDSAVDPEAATRTLLTRLVRQGRVARRGRGLYGAVP